MAGMVKSNICVLSCSLLLALTAMPALAQDSTPAKKPAAQSAQHPKPAAAPAAGAQSADSWVTKEIPAKDSASSKKAAGGTTAASNPCKGLDATGCTANKACTWIVPKPAADSAESAGSPFCQKSKSNAAAKPAAKPAATEAKAKAPVTEPAADKTEKAKPAAVAKPAKQDAPAVAEPDTAVAPAPEQKAADTVEAAPAAPAASETAEPPAEQVQPVQQAAPAPVQEPGKRKAVPAAAGLYVVH